VLAVCSCGGLVGGYLIKEATGGLGPVRTAAADFIADLEAGDANGAYSRLCGRTQSRFSREGFEQGLAMEPKITDHRIVGINVRNSSGTSTATVTAELTTGSGFKDSHTFPLIKENGDWKVCGNPY